MQSTKARKPDWLRVKLPAGESFKAVKKTLASGRLHTVCEEARCPNQGECWGAGTATFMLLGDTCTRGCAFCAVTRGNPNGTVDSEEPTRIAKAARELGLEYVVLTSVTRDDLGDGGAELYARTIKAIREELPKAGVEVLIPDYLGASLRVVAEAEPDGAVVFWLGLLSRAVTV